MILEGIQPEMRFVGSLEIVRVMHYFGGGNAYARSDRAYADTDLCEGSFAAAFSYLYSGR
jgi:hypothetical protein